MGEKPTNIDILCLRVSVFPGGLRGRLGSNRFEPNSHAAFDVFL